MSSRIEDAAVLYRKTSTPQRREGLEFIAEVSPNPGDTVLDLGCGTGELTAHLAELVGPKGKVVGVDPDGTRIKIAQETYQHVKNLTIVEGSGEKFPNMTMETYDLIFSNYVLHWISNKQLVFDQAYRSIKPGGTIAVQFGRRFSSQVETLVSELFPDFLLSIKEPFYFENTESVREYLERAGFVITKCCEYTSRATFKTLFGYCQWLQGTIHGIIDPSMITVERLDKVDLSFMSSNELGEDTFFRDLPIARIIAMKR